MQFICEPCKDGADSLVSDKLRKEMHARCRGGTWCDCQHGVKK